MSMEVSEVLMFLVYMNMAYVLCYFPSFLYSSGSWLYYGIFPPKYTLLIHKIVHFYCLKVKYMYLAIYAS